MAALVLLAGTLCLPLAGCFDADYGTTEPPGYDLRVPLTAPRDADPVGFVEVNKRGETEQVEIIVGYSQPRPTGRSEVHLHSGTCEQPGAVVRSLDDLVEGRSNTLVPIGYDDLLTDAYAVDVHPRERDGQGARACAEIVDGELG